MLFKVTLKFWNEKSHSDSRIRLDADQKAHVIEVSSNLKNFKPVAFQDKNDTHMMLVSYQIEAISESDAYILVAQQLVMEINTSLRRKSNIVTLQDFQIELLKSNF